MALALPAVLSSIQPASSRLIFPVFLPLSPPFRRFRHCPPLLFDQFPCRSSFISSSYLPPPLFLPLTMFPVPFLISRPLLTLPTLLIGLSLLAHASPSAKRWHRIDKRFVLHRHQWHQCQLTWSFRDPFLLFHNEKRFRQAKKVIGEAIRKWELAAAFSAVPSLRLIDVSPASRDSPLNSRRLADIDIFFAEFGHGDSESFDGNGGLVAHSAYPPLGIVHFDASERWHIGQKAVPSKRNRHPKGNRLITRRGGNTDKDGIGARQHQSRRERAQSPPSVVPSLALDLRYVALHEIGHALGLRHSTYRHSVMNSYYRQKLTIVDGQTATDGFRLSKDDEAAIGELFGEKCHRKKSRRKSLL